MVSTQLQKARDFEARQGAQIPDPERPVFHATPTVGWMNDPNGFSVYQGKCHLFYQYHPYSNEWGPMHWGHLTTQDFIHWERLPAALAPDQPFDDAGCFSGGAVELPDGKHLLMYTGVRREQNEKGAWHDVQTQCVAIGDGLNYEKYALNFERIDQLEYRVNISTAPQEQPGTLLRGPLLLLPGEPRIAAIEFTVRGRKPLAALTIDALKQRGLEDLFLFKARSFGKESASLNGRCSLDLSKGGSQLYIRNSGRSPAGELKAEPGDFIITKQGDFVGIVTAIEDFDMGRRQEAKCFVFPEHFKLNLVAAIHDIFFAVVPHLKGITFFIIFIGKQSEYGK